MSSRSYFVKSVLLISLVLGLVSCDWTDKRIKESLSVSLQLKVYKNDTIQLFYLINTDDSYTESLSIKQYVEGKDQLQELSFELPVTVRPKNIRIDLGNQAHYQDSVKIESISFRYREQTLEGSNGIYKKWFTPNENIFFDNDTLVHRLRVYNDFYDPQLNGNKLLNTKLVKLFPPDIYERRIYID